jgi:hypothetical protein
LVLAIAVAGLGVVKIADHLAGIWVLAAPALYFSVVTAATVGFGDISPASHTAQALVASQIMVTAFGLALFIANIVGKSPAVETPAPSGANTDLPRGQAAGSRT